MSSNVRRKGPPFAQIPRWILQHPDISGNDVRIWAVIYAHAFNEENRSTILTQEQIAEESVTSIATVRRSLVELQKIQSLEVETRKNTHGIKASRYTLLEDMPTAHFDGSGPLKMTGPRTAQNDGSYLSSIEDINNTMAAPREEELEKFLTPFRDIKAALCETLGLDQERFSSMEHSRVGKAVKIIRETGATTNQVRDAVARSRELFPSWPLTDLAIANHWSELTSSDSNKSETPREITPILAWTTYDEGGWYLDGVGMTVYDEPPVPRPSPGAPVAP